MMLVKADAFDVVPRRGLVAEEALIHVGPIHAGSLHGNHFEMHHIMTGRRLVALDAVHRTGGWVSEFGNRPLVRGVALSTVLTEELEMSVIVGVAGGTVEDRFLRRNVGVRRHPELRPGQKCAVDIIIFQLTQTDLRQHDVVHIRR